MNVEKILCCAVIACGLLVMGTSLYLLATLGDEIWEIKPVKKPIYDMNGTQIGYIVEEPREPTPLSGAIGLSFIGGFLLFTSGIFTLAIFSNREKEAK